MVLPPSPFVLHTGPAGIFEGGGEFNVSLVECYSKKVSPETAWLNMYGSIRTEAFLSSGHITSSKNGNNLLG